MSKFEDKVDLRTDFRENMARTSSEDAARAIIKGIERDKHRVLIGFDAHLIDRAFEIILAARKFLGRVTQTQYMSFSIGAGLGQTLLHI